jgi:hypothetical protein
MSDKFHSTECALRHNGTECTCGWDERRKQEALENLHKKATLNLKKAGINNVSAKPTKKNQSAIKELIEETRRAPYAVLSEETSELCRRAEEEYNALISGKCGDTALV